MAVALVRGASAAAVDAFLMAFRNHEGSIRRPRPIRFVNYIRERQADELDEMGHSTFPALRQQRAPSGSLEDSSLGFPSDLPAPCLRQAQRSERMPP